ncbi:methionyl-tRNA formyltransferase [Helicobacter sp. 13S00477-4]|uniref:methionyl-tRNA formyltransferase n=1 Tax=Helicobacter sp. 13S00477-4 TaxID=1905759 RepID=UPI000BA5F38E|nr:methionyl-tRNA formyltransferase [Helicobacter sp. 13S00477-4]PAF52739.1 methionyl-tRNA formyltransferase [Helicobacter sp. 13S00477-4]
MKILFMGTPNFAQIILEALLNDPYFEVVGLFAQPDKPFGRKQEIRYPQTKELLLKKNISIPIFQPEVLDEKSVKNISDLKPDIILVVAYGKILPKKILSLARCLNIHASLLPKYRGASPIQEMILNDEEFYGICVIDMEERLDSGNILGKIEFKREKYFNIEYLSNILAQMGSALIVDVLKNLRTIQSVKQDDSLSTYCKKIVKQDGIIEFDEAKKIYLKFLAYFNWPGIFLRSGLKLFDIGLISETNCYQRGEILDIKDNSIFVGCSFGILRIGMLQSPGRQKTYARNYIQGKRLKIGDLLI